MECDKCCKFLEQFDHDWAAYDGKDEGRALCYKCLTVLWDYINQRKMILEKVK